MEAADPNFVVEEYQPLAAEGKSAEGIDSDEDSQRLRMPINTVCIYF